MTPTSPRQTTRHGALLLLALSACEQPAAPVRPGVVLDIDGLEIHESDLAPMLAYLATTGERLGRNYQVQGVLDQYLIPLKLAQRAFAEQRKPLRERAEALRRAVKDAGDADPQLREKSAAIRGAEAPGLVNRSIMDLPQAAWCFDPNNLGLVSPVLELPHGFCVMSFRDYKPGLQRSQDESDVYLVPFFSHDVRGFARWYDEQKPALAKAVRYCHPDYRDALPHWLRAGLPGPTSSR